MGWFDKLKFSRLSEGLSKTRDEVVGKINKLIAAKGTIDEDTLEKIEEILIAGDVGVDMSLQIVEKIRERVKSEKYTSTDELDQLIRDEMQELLMLDIDKPEDPFFIPESKKPYIIMIIGVNGVGKTTTIGKLAHHYKSNGYKVMIGAADTFRAAANEQLEIWAQRAGVEIIQQKHGADPAAVAFDTVTSAVSRKADVVIIDTAGRLHTRVNLMEELKKIKRVLQKKNENHPHEVFLVLDASTGQNAIQQARQFNTAVGITGLVVTKLDGTAKGGVVFAIERELDIPVKFVGVGEKLEDLQPFDPEVFVDALFQVEREAT